MSIYARIGAMSKGSLSRAIRPLVLYSKPLGIRGYASMTPQLAWKPPELNKLRYILDAHERE